jgi:hypothetical protein
MGQWCQRPPCLSGLHRPNERSRILYDGLVNLSTARVITALRAFVTALKQMSEGYAQGPPGC